MAYQRTIEQLEEELTERRERLKELREKENALEESDPQAVAEFLHDKECGFNHNDACFWGHETWGGKTPSGNWTRTRWLHKAEQFIELAKKYGVPVNVALELRTIKLEER